MPPFTGKLLSLVEQLAPNLPAATREVLRNALSGRQPASSPDRPPPFPCLAQPGIMPDLSALLGRRRQGRPAPYLQTETETEAGTFSIRTAATPNGPITYKLFVPEGPTEPQALVVMLHGCTQNADDFAAGTAMNAVAQHHNVLVAYPEQPKGANMSGCWNWFLPQNQHRDGGEAAAIATVTRDIMRTHAIAPRHAFVAGLSAGGAMAAIMAEAYPDLYGGVGIHSGLAYRSAHDVASAFAAMRQGPAAIPDEAGSLAAGVPTIVFHGDADATVHPNNAEVILARLNARETGLRPTTEEGRSPNGRAFVRTTGQDAAGRVRFESWTVKGAGHAWSGGSARGSYTDPAGPDASAAMLRFFLAQTGDAERTRDAA